jgi:hypothetical protein
MVDIVEEKKQVADLDSNWVPRDYKSSALPTELLRTDGRLLTSTHNIDRYKLNLLK